MYQCLQFKIIQINILILVTDHKHGQPGYSPQAWGIQAVQQGSQHWETQEQGGGGEGEQGEGGGQGFVWQEGGPQGSGKD